MTSSNAGVLKLFKHVAQLPTKLQSVRSLGPFVVRMHRYIRGSAHDNAQIKSFSILNFVFMTRAAYLPQHAFRQCRINNSSKCSNYYWPRAFGDTAVLCVKFVFLYMREWILEFRCQRQTQKGNPIFYICCTDTLFAESKLNFSFRLRVCF